MPRAEDCDRMHWWNEISFLASRTTLPWNDSWISVFGFCGGFLGGCLRGFFRAIFFEKNELEKNPLKNPPKNPRFSRDLFDQNPPGEISGLILGLKYSLLLENFNRWSCLSTAREGLGSKKKLSRLKNSFRIESLIFWRLPLEIEFCQSLCPLGYVWVLRPFNECLIWIGWI